MEIKRLNEAYDFSSLTAQPREHLSEELLQEGPAVWDYLKDKGKAALANSKIGQKIRDIKDPEGAITGENAEKEAEQRQSYLNKKAAHVIANDFRPVNAESSFYIKNDYSKAHRMSQEQWKAWQKQQRAAADGDPDKLQELDDTIQDAIVVDRNGYYTRRGAEDLTRKLTRFKPGENDQVGGQYRSGSYKYHKSPRGVQAASETAEEDDSVPVNKSSGKELITKVTKMAVMTGMPIYSDEKCSTPLKKLDSSNFNTAYVKVKNKPVSLTSWAASMKKEKLL